MDLDRRLASVVIIFYTLLEPLQRAELDVDVEEVGTNLWKNIHVIKVPTIRTTQNAELTFQACPGVLYSSSF